MMRLGKEAGLVSVAEAVRRGRAWLPTLILDSAAALQQSDS